jgi:hypothetical protein
MRAAAVASAIGVGGAASAGGAPLIGSAGPAFTLLEEGEEEEDDGALATKRQVMGLPWWRCGGCVGAGQLSAFQSCQWVAVGGGRRVWSLPRGNRGRGQLTWLLHTTGCAAARLAEGVTQRAVRAGCHQLARWSSAVTDCDGPLCTLLAARCRPPGRSRPRCDTCCDLGPWGPAWL